jgi:hypothetical protein
MVSCPAPGSEALCAPGDIVLNHCVVWYGWYGCFCVSVNLLVICIYIYVYIGMCRMCIYLRVYLNI